MQVKEAVQQNNKVVAHGTVSTNIFPSQGREIFCWIWKTIEKKHLSTGNELLLKNVNINSSEHLTNQETREKFSEFLKKVAGQW